MNRLFVAFKPKNISSNHYLSRLKRKYGVKKAGFSGTLDPFASGVLIVAFGSYTRFFRFLRKSPKCYVATIWLGAKSDSLDNRNITEISVIPPFELRQISEKIANLTGEIEFLPPKFSAKMINGERAYNLAKKGVEFEMKMAKMRVFKAEIISYSHPFLTLYLELSEGGYARSFGQLLAANLGVNATLSALERVREGKFTYQNEQELNPLEFLDVQNNDYLGDPERLLNGKALNLADFARQNDGIYLVKFGQFYAILEFANGEISYLLNRIEL